MSDSHSRIALVGVAVLALMGALILFFLPGSTGPEAESAGSASRRPVPTPEVATRAPLPVPSAVPTPAADATPAGDAHDAVGPSSGSTPDSPGGDGASGTVGEERSDPQEPERTRFPLDREGIGDAIDSQRGELKACYDTLLDSYGGDPGLDGRIEVAFDVDATGRVVAADIESSAIDSVYLEGCVVTAMEDLTFDVGSEVTVTYPIRFRQNAQGDE